MLYGLCVTKLFTVMKNIAISTPLFCPDIIDYIKGRDEVCKIVLAACRKQVRERCKTVSLHTKLFTDLNFAVAEIIKVILETGKALMIKFSYSLILQLDDSFTVEDMASQLWKYMCRVCKNN